PRPVGAVPRGVRLTQLQLALLRPAHKPRSLGVGLLPRSVLAHVGRLVVALATGGRQPPVVRVDGLSHRDGARRAFRLGGVRPGGAACAVEDTQSPARWVDLELRYRGAHEEALPELMKSSTASWWKRKHRADSLTTPSRRSAANL